VAQNGMMKLIIDPKVNQIQSTKESKHSYSGYFQFEGGNDAI